MSAISSTDPWHVVSAIFHLREAASDLDTALAFTNILCLFAAGPDGCATSTVTSMRWWLN